MPLDKRTGRGLKFSDREVCKYALEGLCPYGLFRNTKSDLGGAFAPAGVAAADTRWEPCYTGQRQQC